MKTKIKCYNSWIVTISLAIFSLILLGSSGGEKDNAPSPPPVPMPNPKKSTIILDRYFPPIHGRKIACPYPQPPNMWTGENSDNHLDPESRNYFCEIRVVGIGNYSKQYYWKNTPSNYTSLSCKMEFELPDKGDYNIEVNFYEIAGDFWENCKSARGHWKAAVTYPVHKDQISIGSQPIWTFSAVEFSNYSRWWWGYPWSKPLNI